MWPSISDMSRDECRKCLRCLELDAYGNMVSVLRAQGPFTDEKRKLLGELAKVLHISNERHRAEIRRAVNDEKLTVIAEQLNGPNTRTDWAIEGRRTIPLLPRLKAHTAFTGLANSLSLVIAAANEKKCSSTGRAEDPKIKAETTLRDEDERADRPKVSISHTEMSPRGKKRKRSGTGSSDGEKIRKAQFGETTNTDESSLSPSERGVVASPFSIQDNEFKNVLQVSIVTPSSPIDTTSARNDDTRESDSSMKISNNRKFVGPSISPNSVKTKNSMTDTRTTIPITNIQRNCHDIDDRPDCPKSRLTDEVDDGNANPRDQRSVEPRLKVAKNLQLGDKETRGDEKIVEDSTEMKEKRKISRPDSTTPGSTNCVMTVNSGSTTSCGPGPPCVTPSAALLTYKKLPAGALNHHSGTKMGVTLNSGKTLKINAHPNARLANKANVIVVKKGSSRGVTLSHGGKEVLGKVIMGGKNLCLASQRSSLALLPRRDGASSNGDTNLTKLSPNHADSLKFGPKAGNIIMLDIRKDVSNENTILASFLDTSGTRSSDSKTADPINSNDVRESFANDRSYDSSKSIVTKNPKYIGPISNGLTVVSSEKHEALNDHSSLCSLSVNADSSNVGDNRVIHETIKEEEIETDVAPDAQTGIYNYESADEIIIEERMEESIETSCIDIFSTSLDYSPDINLDNLRYANDEDHNEIVIESRDDAALNESLFCENVQELDDS